MRSSPCSWTATRNGWWRGRGASSAARLSRPDDDAASHEAYEQLLRALYAEGWQPYERGRQWWEMRLRHGGDHGDVDAGATWLIGRLTRASLVRGGAALAAGGAALAVWPRTTVSAPSAKQDARSWASR